MVNPVDFVRNIDILWTVAHALTASDATICLAYLLNAAVIADEIGASGLAVGLHLFRAFIAVHVRFGNGVALVHALVVVAEVARNVDAVRTRHAVLAAGAGDKRILAQAISDFSEKFHVICGERHKRRVGPEVVLEVFHIGHSAQYRQHILRSAGKAERP